MVLSRFHTTQRPNYNWSGPLAFENSSDTSSIAIVRLDPADFTDRALLNFRLEVSDQAGANSDIVRVAVLPQARPPHIVVDRFPAKPSYEPGDAIYLYASCLLPIKVVL